MPGTSYVDALKILEDDDATQGILPQYLLLISQLGIILIGEVGGDGELRALDYIKETGLDKKKYDLHYDFGNARPMITYFAGVCAVPGYTMGHSGKLHPWRSC